MLIRLSVRLACAFLLPLHLPVELQQISVLVSNNLPIRVNSRIQLLISIPSILLDCYRPIRTPLGTSALGLFRLVTTQW